MPFDSNGNFSLVPGTIVSDGMTIQPSQHNPPFQDVANGLSQVVLRDGRAPLSGNLNANGYKVTGLADGISDTDAATVAQTIIPIGDFRDTALDLSSDDRFLPRDGSLYNDSDYPELANILGPATDVVYNNVTTGTTKNYISIRRVTPTVVIAIGATGTSTGSVYTSSNNSTFTEATLSGFRANGTGGRNRAAFGNGVFAVNGLNASGPNTIWTASEISGPWTQQSTFGAPNAAAGPMAFHSGFFYVAIFPTGSYPEIYRSASGSSWSLVHTISTGSLFTDFVSNGTDLLLLFANGEGVKTTDGVSWTPFTIPATTNSIAWSDSANSWAVGVNSEPSIFFSPDGSSWVDRDISDIFGGSSARVSVGNYSQGFIVIKTMSPHIAAVTIGDTVLIRVADAPIQNTWGVRSISQAAQIGNEFLIGGTNGEMIRGSVDAIAGKFRVPNDKPQYGWIRAK